MTLPTRALPLAVLLCVLASAVSGLQRTERYVQESLSMASQGSMDSALMETDSATAALAHEMTTQCGSVNASDSSPRTLSCCQGFLCPYQNAVCCAGTSHCCPSGTTCAVTCATCPPLCRPIGAPAPQPVVVPLPAPVTSEADDQAGGNRRVVKIELRPSDSQVKTMRAEEQSEKQKEVQARREQQDDVKKRHEEFRKKLQEAAAKRRNATAAREHDEKATRNKEMEKIRIIMNLAVGHPDFDASTNITTNFASNITSAVAGNNDKDVIEMDQEPDDEAMMTGHPWPPMAAVLNDGLGGIWVKINNIDWMGFGLIRNGTLNRVSNIEDCRLQCEALQECRMFKFVHTNRECWLDSAIAKRASACGLVNGKRECVSFVKKNQRWDANYEWGVTSPKDRDFRIVNQQNWLGAGDPKNGGRLIRNGRRNQVGNLSECISQCAAEKYCRAMTYFRPNGECWLSSQVAEKGTRCARRLGRRDCVSYIKRKTNPERREGPVPEVKVSGTAEHQSITIDNTGTGQGATTLSINLPK